MRGSAWCGLGAAALLAAACGGDPAGPSTESAPGGVALDWAGDGAVAHQAAGEPAEAGSPLEGEFAVAVPDSLGGLVVLSYDAGTSGLFILQVREAEAGTYACGDVTAGLPCHARYFENVREEEGVIVVDGRLDLTGGSLVLAAVGASVVRGSLDAHFERTAGTGPASLDVTGGVIDVPLLGGALANGGLTCLIGLTGGGTPCPE